MSVLILQILARSENDLILAREKTRRVAALAGFSRHDQTRLITAVSEIVRITLQHAGACSIRFSVIEQDGKALLEVTVTDSGPGAAHIKVVLEGSARDGDLGVTGARRLVDQFSIQGAPGEASVTLAKFLPARASADKILEWREVLVQETRPSPLEEVERHNQEMLQALDDLRQKETELARQLEEAARLNRELERANDELDRTNKGVISLYKEIEDKNTELLHEIKERRATEEQLARSNTELEHFAYIASHDLQEPLRMIGSFLQLLALEYGEQIEDEGREYIRFAVDGARRMQELIDDLLAYSRVDKKGKPFVSTDMEEVLEDVLWDLQHVIKESGATVTRDPLPTIMADSLQMKQLLQNLVKNGIKFRRQESPRVHLSVQDKAEEWIFSVRDNGIGIEQQYHERIFIIFQRLHTRDEYAGTGIGLAICKRIVDRHCGRIWIESEPGRGSTFFFAIPHSPCQHQQQGGGDA